MPIYYIMHILWSFSEGSEQVHADLFIGPTIILIQLVQIKILYVKVYIE